MIFISLTKSALPGRFLDGQEWSKVPKLKRTIKEVSKLIMEGGIEYVVSGKGF